MVFDEVADFFFPLNSLFLGFWEVVLNVDLMGSSVDFVDDDFHFVVSIGEIVYLHFLRFRQFLLLIFSLVGEIVQL